MSEDSDDTDEDEDTGLLDLDALDSDEDILTTVLDIDARRQAMQMTCMADDAGAELQLLHSLMVKTRMIQSPKALHAMNTNGCGLVDWRKRPSMPASSLEGEVVA